MNRESLTVLRVGDGSAIRLAAYTLSNTLGADTCVFASHRYGARHRKKNLSLRSQLLRLGPSFDHLRKQCESRRVDSEPWNYNENRQSRIYGASGTLLTFEGDIEDH